MQTPTQTPINATHVGTRAAFKKGIYKGVSGKIVPNDSGIGGTPYIVKAGMLRINVRTIEEVDLLE